MTKVGLALILILGMTGCGIHPQLVDPSSSNEAMFRPATQQPPSTPTVQAPVVPNLPTPVVVCIDNLSFINDQTIPDGTQVAPSSTLDKRWEVENNGSCNWDERYQIRLIGGPDMGANPVQPLFPARSGSQVIIRILMTAPDKAGSYHSAWQAYNPADEPFGDPFYIDIVVK